MGRPATDTERPRGRRVGASSRARARALKPCVYRSLVSREGGSVVRRVPSLLLLSFATPAFIGLPTVTLPAAAAHPVSASVQQLALAGVDSSALAESPAPEDEPAETVAAAGNSAAARRDALNKGSRAAQIKRTPVAVTPKRVTSSFSALGVTWAADARVSDVAVQVRTHSRKGWSAWTEVEVEGNGAPDSGTEADGERAGSDPLYVGPSDGVQVRVDGASVKPRDLKLSLIDPGSSAADATAAVGPRTIGGSQAQAAVSLPTYVTRAGWGANESYRTCTPSTAATIKGGVLHTTATGNNYTAAEAPAVMRSMYAYHTRSLGWCDIGYNFLVDKYGTLYEGRYGGVDRAVIGAHTGGFNTGTFGVSMIGNHDLVAPTVAQLRTVEQVFAWKLAMYGRDPQGTTTYTSGGGSATTYPAGTVVTKAVISGHRDYSTKSCPGNRAYPMLPQIRAAVAELIADGAARRSEQVASAVTLSASPASLTSGAITTLSGKLTAGDRPLAARQVGLYVRKEGSSTWSLLSTHTTSATGTFSITDTPGSSQTYAARFDGDTNYAASAREVSVTVTPKTTATKAATSLTAVASPTTMTYGTKATVRGKLTRTTGAALAGRPVLVYVKYGSGAWSLAGTVSTTSDGTYAFRHAAKANAKYGVRFRGGAADLAASRDVAVRVAAKTTAVVSSSSSRVGRTVRVSGKVTPAHAGQRVQRQQRINGAWVTLSSAKLSSAGTFSFSVRPTTGGTKYYRVVKPADADHVTGVSPTRRLVIR